ncbi:murein biosynthesis integral membrane protein MurJ [Ruminiclostridium herbifermentans]|uniref:Probable lipid II flippase MurJ n=1 Tax=Ruminiclostridium herbifermentans TaxID=2488810 RepID=A0A7H1VJ30_9FIRM|nr:murein biosynthesis integral membrane protein MurJ [Ruminiclostridium herbifermentans]QNU65392.1 murein biosynthesis integral membrane protein MurJ [Ruminiclostridium herbifermentans]
MNSKNKKITGAAIIVMTSIVVSRITGYLRTILINNLLTASQSDALMAAFKTTDLMYNLLIGGAIAAAVIPVLSGYLAKNEEEDGWKAVGTFINVIFIAMIVLCILGVIFAPTVVSITALGFYGEKRELTIQLTRVLFPSVAFMMLAGLTNGVLNSYQRFAAAAYGPSIYNLGVALSIFVLSRFGVKYVAYGILASAVMYFIIQISFAFPNFKYYRPKILWKHQGFRRLFKLAIPSLLASAIVQVNLIITQRFTSLYDLDGGITAYGNANDLWQLPYGVFAMGLGTALLPTLSEKLALKKLDEFKDILNNAFRTILYLIIPSAVGCIVLAKPLISVVYKWSQEIGFERISLAGEILIMFSAAMIAQSMLAILTRAFYANNDTKTPLYIGVLSMVLNYLFCTIFFEVTDLGVAGMALSYSMISVVYMIIMMSVLTKKMNGMQWTKLIKYSGKLTAAAVIMGIVIFFMNRLISIDFLQEFSIQQKLLEILILGVEIALGVLVYFAATMLLKVNEAIMFKDRIFNRINSIFNRLKG